MERCAHCDERFDRLEWRVTELEYARKREQSMRHRRRQNIKAAKQKQIPEQVMK